MRTTAPPRVETAPATTLWRCGGRDCGAGECEHEENELHRHAAAPGPALAPPVVHEVLRSPGAPLPDGVRREMEGRLGHDFADVRVHSDATAGASALAVGAHAYTVGRDVVFAPGRFEPATADGRRLLAHELAHAATGRRSAAGHAGALRVSSPDEPAERSAAAVAATVDEAPSGSTPADAATLHRQPAPAPAPAPPAPPVAPAPPAAPATCMPARRLTWADFTGTPPARSRFHALTAFDFASRASAGRDWIVATFDGASSWVRPQSADPGNRAVNGCRRPVRACQRFFDRLAPGRTGEWSLQSGGGCAASPQPDTSLKATSRGQCDTVLGAECDRVAALESARLLHHEQLHLDLACAVAAKGNAAIAANPATGTATVLTAVRRTATRQTRAYDARSRHGCDAAGQAAWDTAVARGLPGVAVP